MTSDSQATQTLECELCIVGAGYAALNGLNAAAKYLKQGARVAVIDKNATWGGQWLHSVPAGSVFINCTTHLRARAHQPVLQDSGLVCAPQFALGLTGMSAYFLTHLWLRDDLASVAHKLFRMRLDVDPKLAFAPQLGLMVMANVSMVNPRLPMSIAATYEGDYNRWYPTYRRLPLLAAMATNRDMLLDKAERILRIRFSDAPDHVELGAGAHSNAEPAVDVVN